MNRQATRKPPDRALVRAGFDYGASVRAHDRSRYTGRFGVVEEHNDGEIGVRFKNVAAVIWFSPAELEVSL